MTPLHLAAKKGGRSNIVNHLVDKGAGINIQDTHFRVSETILLITTLYYQFKFLVHVKRGSSIYGLFFDRRVNQPSCPEASGSMYKFSTSE